MNDNIGDDATTRQTLDSYSDDVFSSIDHSWDEDWFAVYFNKAYNYQVWMEGWSLLDPSLTIYGPGGSHEFDSFLYYTPAASGTHYLAAAAFDGGTGTYTLAVERDTPGDQSSAVYASVDAVSPFRERIGHGIDTADWVKVVLNAGTNYQFDLIGAADDGGATLPDPWLALRNSAGTSIIEDDDSGVGTNSRIFFTPTVSGTYTLDVQALFTGDSGSYQLLVNASPVAGTIGTDDIVFDSLMFAGDVDLFAINLSAGTSYNFGLFGDTLADPYLELLDSAGRTVTVSDNGAGLDSHIFYQAVTSGQYFLAARDYGHDSAGTYSLMTWVDGPVRNGSAGNDSFSDASGSETIDGGNGTDTVTYVGRASGHIVAGTPNGFTVSPRSGAFWTDKLNNIENVLFDDRGPYAPGAGGSAAVNAAGGTIDGGGGLDTLYLRGTHTQYAIHHTANGFNVTGNGVNEWVANVERLAFTDGFIGLDVHGNAGMAYRIYQAAFDRTPDVGGLGFWINMMDNGMSVTEAAANFVGSVEFQNTYGTLGNNQFAAQLYRNVLHRESDPGGLSFWTDALGSGRLSKPEVLAAFSESNENQANLIGVIQDGMYYNIPA